jgi:hypothetical protein
MPRPISENPSPATLRSRRSRERAKLGVRVIPIEINEAEIDALSSAGLIADAATDADLAVALKAMLNATRAKLSPKP